MNKSIWMPAIAGLLAACGSNDSGDKLAESGETAGTAQEKTEQVETAVADAPPAGFAQCRTCHTVEKDGNNGVGPNLWNVAGEAAAQKAGFSYSPAMKDGDLTWDDPTLHAYLENPFKAVPGTKMAFAGLKDEAKRTEVITYLSTLKD